MNINRTNREQTDEERLKAKLGDRWWRLNNLYYIKDKAGSKVLFKPNWAQTELYSNLHHFNVVLKARQLGFTTFCMIYFLDACLFNSNHAAGVVAHDLDSAQDLFDNKARFAYDNLPAWLKQVRPAKQDTAKKIVFSNGSSITVGTSLRSGTFQKLLISEYGKVSAKYPDKAREIKTGAFNTVDAGQQIIVESTAEGKGGEFYDLCETAQKLRDSGDELNPLQPKFFFFPWHKNPEYTLGYIVPIDKKTATYLGQFDLTDGQKYWYAAKQATMADDMQREYPSTPGEAFESSNKGAFYLDEMAWCRNNNKITVVPMDPSHGVYTFWDLGVNDLQCVWFGQVVNGELRLIDYAESSNEGWNYWAELLRERKYNYIKHFFPHDGAHRVQGGEIMTRQELAGQAGIFPIEIIPRTNSSYEDIRAYCKPTLRQCCFDYSNCARGIDHLDNYKRVWDKSTGAFLKKPYHDEASNGADAFRTAAVAFKTGKLNKSAPITMRATKITTLHRNDRKKSLRR